MNQTNTPEDKVLPIDIISDSCERTDVPKCPMCGHENRDWWDVSSSWLDSIKEKTIEVECGDCGQPYRVEFRVDYYFYCDFVARKR